VSAKLGVGERSTQSMLCPCCGESVFRGARECNCGARFVGEPLDETPIKVQRLGPAMTSIALLALVVVGALVATKWIAAAGALVMWSAWRAVKLARRNAEWYGGYKTAVTTLTLTTVGCLGIATYGIAHIPKAIENYKLRQTAATEASMHHAASLLEDYRLKVGSGSYPGFQEFKMVMGESVPGDYWDNSIKYQPVDARLADTAIGISTLYVDSFELHSNGPDGVAGNDDDIIMRDGIFLTSAEVKKKTLAQQPR